MLAAVLVLGLPVGRIWVGAAMRQRLRFQVDGSRPQPNARDVRNLLPSLQNWGGPFSKTEWGRLGVYGTGSGWRKCIRPNMLHGLIDARFDPYLRLETHT